ncbi:MAG: TRAP transporter permease [Proteobacteria bacterium]|nr:TRAP transporter permease [Pseudomonadota bacterium]
MTNLKAADGPLDKQQFEDLVADIDTGARRPGGLVGKALFLVALAWSLYQLYTASPLPFITGILLIDDQQARAIHLAFATFLAFCSYPAFRSSPRERIPAYDWVLAAVGAFSSLFIILFYEQIVGHTGGVRTMPELIVSMIGFLCLLEITRRALGIPLVVVACIFALYAFAGPWTPQIISHRGVSLNRFVDHMWLTTEGVFGIALGVSNSFIFLFVLFGSLLQKAGAGNFFIKLSFALLGHLRGGPAKAAVVSSGMTGLVSGSAIANIVTTGTFTIPLMKRVGYTPEQAGAVETSSSINGQIMPPVMGAAAFIMTEFIGISYYEVVKHAFLPAVISYIALYYIVHLEAVKANMPVIARKTERTLVQKTLAFALSVAGVVAVGAGVFAAIELVKAIAGGGTVYLVILLFAAAYLALLWLASRYPDLEIDDPTAPLVRIPETLPVLMAGLYYLLPVIVLIWCLVVERFSPGLAVSWSVAALVAEIVTQRPIIAAMRGQGGAGALLKAGIVDLIDGLVIGARNMVNVAVALASAGIIVGVVSLTGLGLLMTGVIETISGGNLMAMLLVTALMCIILGMGLPTTANYIVVISVMAHPIVTLAAQGGLIVPLIAVHLFVFYFGLISGTTPPVAVDAFAGAAVARADPLKTCVISFYYSMRTTILPFIFVFNTELLMIGIQSVVHFLMTVSAAVLAMLVFAAGTQRYFLTWSRHWESAALLLVAFTLLRPGFWLDRVWEPFDTIDPMRIEEFVQKKPSESNLRLRVEGPNFSGQTVNKVVLLPLGANGPSGAERLKKAAGLTLAQRDGKVMVANIDLNSPAQQWGMDFDWEIQEVQVEAERPDKEWFYIPGLLLLGLVVFAQRRRKAAEPAPAGAGG